MDPAVIALIVLFLSACLYIDIRTKRNKLNSTKNFYKIYTPNGLKLVKELERMFEDNENLKWFGERNLYLNFSGEKADIEKLDIEDLIGIKDYLDENERSLKYIAGDYYTTLVARLNLRFSSQYQELDAFDENQSYEKFGLNIEKGEYIHLEVGRVDWYEEKTITTSVSYGGFQVKSGSKNGLTYRMGNLIVTPHKKQQFQAIDRGSLYLTNKRIIFIGLENKINKTIDIDNILEYSIFQNGILIGKANGKKPLIVFEEYIIQENKAPNKRDHLNRVVRVLERILCQNQFQDFIGYQKKD